MLCKEICLKCCRRTRKKLNPFFHRWAKYERTFEQEWRQRRVWCERQQSWVSFGILYPDSDEWNEKMIAECPFLLEHTVQSC